MDHEHYSCNELLSNLSSYIDGDLNDDLCGELQKHLAGCENCRVVYDTTTRTIYMYQNNPSDQALPAGVRERLYSKLNLDDLLKKQA